MSGSSFRPGDFSVGDTFQDEHGELDRIWASASGREARAYFSDDGESILTIDGRVVERCSGVEDVHFSPDGRRVLYVRFGELIEDGQVLCRGSYIQVFFSPDGSRWAVRWQDPDGVEVCHLDGVEVFRAPWDHYMGGSDWRPPWTDPTSD